uniref:C2H2-type domain-containing protein n=2 Tax=Dendroctonus ponderosae TaxID=77166 RepID=A0AAR5PUK6_DENPD
MDKSIDNYLHKKFKKQLSIDTNAYQQNDKENKNSLRGLEQSEEKTAAHRSSPVKDNNRSTVPNESTNSQNHNSRMPVASAPELSKSSISNESGNSKPCISNEHEEIRCRSFSFDTPFRLSETTKISSNLPSSATDYSYYSQNQDNRITPPPPQEDGLSKDEFKSEESATMPEKTPNGKYVCPYCNLVCSKPSVLQKHIRAHTNERPYPCTSCGFSFKTRSNLYKHCRSRTHANRVMGVKAQENSGELDGKQNYTDNATQTQNNSTNEEAYSERCQKPYKPRFHTVQPVEEDDKAFRGTDLSHHINEIINKNNSIVNSSDPNLLKRRFGEALIDTGNNNEYISRSPTYSMESKPDEPLNLTNKNRKRSMSEIAEPVMQKSLIKELLQKHLYSDMHCPYCKMIFQTVTELELHKMRSCKGKPSEAKYTRSSSVNVASILTKNKNAFDNIPQFQNSVFPLNSPGPFLGKTRLVESDKSKSFSFDAVNLPVSVTNEPSPKLVLSPVHLQEERKPYIKLFGGEVKIHDSSGEIKSYIFDSIDSRRSSKASYSELDAKVIESRVVKSCLQSGGTILTNKSPNEKLKSWDMIRVYDNASASSNVDGMGVGKLQSAFDTENDGYHSEVNQSSARSSLAVSTSEPKSYPNITDFSKNALKLLTPNLKHPHLHISGILPQNIALTHHLPASKQKHDLEDNPSSNISVDSDKEARGPCQPVKRSGVIQKNNQTSASNIYNPMNLLVNGKVVRYVPGMPGPVAAEEPLEIMYGSNIVAVSKSPREALSPMQPPFAVATNQPSRSSPIIVQKAITPIIEKAHPQRQEYMDSKSIVSSSKVAESTSLSTLKVFSERQRSPEKVHELKPPSMEISSEPKKFIRPNSLPLKPTTASLKQHHGLTPTIFNQILISPDTPRVAKKYAHQLFNGNYFSYLGLKSSTKPVYCTLNKTQPFYVPHFKKLSMYSEWRQQDTKVDKMYVSSYDSRQRNQRFTTAGKTDANLIIHSSYKFVATEVSSKSDKDDESLRTSMIGGYECNEESPYVRGRGRGRFVCDQCGIRCKKPSMLKKHIRTHSNDRPYSCSHCNFRTSLCSFKTKGNLTKHLKSKAHTKNYSATSSGSGSSTRLSMSQSSESDTDDSGMDSSDESMTRQQEHEAAYGLLSLSQKTAVGASSTEIMSPSGIIRTASPASSADQFMTTEEVAYVSKTNYAKNKILDNLKYNLPNKQITDNISPNEGVTKEDKKLASYLGKTDTARPLTYPYTSCLTLPSPVTEAKPAPAKERAEFPPKSIGQFDVIQKYAKTALESNNEKVEKSSSSSYLPSPVPTLKVNDVEIQDLLQERKRKNTVIETTYKAKMHKNDEVMDLSVASSEKRESSSISRLIVDRQLTYDQSPTDDYSPDTRMLYYSQSPDEKHRTVEELNYRNADSTRKVLNPPSGSVGLLNTDTSYSQDVEMHSNSSSDTTRHMEYDNSAMETLADVATKQEKLDKNILAKNVASQYLKLATQNENMDCRRDSSNSFIPNKDVMNDLISNSEGNKSCTICSKSFIKPFQLRLHMNIHYLERPFRCDTCSVSFRTKGHLQKHERSASHYSKLSSSPAQSSSEPRPFKCSDCSIAFRIHGHLAKHLRSKMHIMKLECLAKIPFGLYAELERSNSLLTEINTSDGDQCLESLKTLAKKVFINDPGKLQTVISEVEVGSHLDLNS